MAIVTNIYCELDTVLYALPEFQNLIFQQTFYIL